MLIYDEPLMSGQPPSSGHLPASLVWPPKGGLAREQALYLRDIVKSGRARGEAKTGDGAFAASPVSRAARFARPNRRACSQANGSLTIGSTSYMYAKHGGHTFWYICLPSRDYYNVRLPYAKFLSVTWEVNRRRRIFFLLPFVF